MFGKRPSQNGTAGRDKFSQMRIVPENTSAHAKYSGCLAAKEDYITFIRFCCLDCRLSGAPQDIAKSGLKPLRVAADARVRA
jgi:hypothetical protein